MDYKLIIIGAGPGGYETALLAARRGIETVLIEAGEVGGTCLNEGCIPTKAFCRNAQLMEDLAKSEVFGVDDLVYSFDFSVAAQRKNAIVEQLKGGVESLLANPRIRLVRGTARFVDAHTVAVGEETFTAENIIIATGSTAATLPIPGNDLPGVITSRELLNIDHVPPRLCIIGAGVIGLEFASIFTSFGSEVTVVEYAKEILPRFDSDMAKRLRQSLGKRGITITTQAAVSAIAQNGDELTVTYTRKGKEETVVADKVLMAVGRRPNLASLNLEEAGIEATPRGVVVNENMQTNVPHIYAIGDIIGGYMLAHAATFQGIRALNHIMGTPDKLNLNVMPAAVFTMPEAATVGLTEDECKEKGIACTCKKSFFRANGKAVCLDETDGFCKLVVGDDGKLLGCHLFGPHAADLVQEVCALISVGATLDDLQNIIHTHPTLGEVIQTAAHS